jgi:hypothetical protein
MICGSGKSGKAHAIASAWKRTRVPGLSVPVSGFAGASRVEVKLFSSFSEMTQDERVVRSRPIADLLSHQIITRARCVGSKASLRVGDALHWVFNAGSRETLNTGSRYAAVQTLGE